ncbi:hypothetical protein L484_025651 [Morus notabilis]|uniref:Uncharacterized protein n=1 Tax=Morus notabilis TaxID=981085 RepID=W9RH07_9ROSA|nr:hypothetical protein L484_025651 [Morus notabilis]
MSPELANPLMKIATQPGLRSHSRRETLTSTITAVAKGGYQTHWHRETASFPLLLERPTWASSPRICRDSKIHKCQSSQRNPESQKQKPKSKKAKLATIISRKPINQILTLMLQNITDPVP